MYEFLIGTNKTNKQNNLHYLYKIILKINKNIIKATSCHAKIEKSETYMKYGNNNNISATITKSNETRIKREGSWVELRWVGLKLKINKIK